MYVIRMGDGVAEAQIRGLSDDELGVLMEIYDVLRLTPENGDAPRTGGNMYTWHHRGLSVVYLILDPPGEVAVLRVNRWPG